MILNYVLSNSLIIHEQNLTKYWRVASCEKVSGWIGCLLELADGELAPEGASRLRLLDGLVECGVDVAVVEHVERVGV